MIFPATNVHFVRRGYFPAHHVWWHQRVWFLSIIFTIVGYLYCLCYIYYRPLSIIIYCDLLLSIIIHYCPLLSIITIIIHYYPLLSIIIHYYHYHPLLSIIIHYYPLLSIITIIIHYYPLYYPLLSIIFHYYHYYPLLSPLLSIIIPSIIHYYPLLSPLLSIIIPSIIHYYPLFSIITIIIHYFPIKIIPSLLLNNPPLFGVSKRVRTTRPLAKRCNIRRRWSSKAGDITGISKGYTWMNGL